MLTEDEKKFLRYWEANRDKEKNLFHQLKIGLPIGIVIGVAIVLNFTTGWYERATMVAFSQSTPIALLFAIIVIALFCAVFFKRHKWEMNEQRYGILSKREELEINNTITMQQEEATGSQE